MKRASVTLENLAVGEIWILFILLASVAEGKYTKLVGMDKKKVCRDKNSVMVDYLKETESALILAKTVEYKDASEAKDCNVILGPDSDSDKQFLLLEFESFHMPDCDVELIIHQCPFVTFDRDIILMRRLGCKDRNPRSLMTKKKHNVRFILHREYVTPKRVYNFRINVTLTDGMKKHEDNMSLGLKIGIVGVSVIAAIIVAIMVFKAVRLRMIVRQEYHHEEEHETHHVLTSLSNSRQRLQPNSYTELTDHGPMDNQFMNADPLNQHPVEVQLAVTVDVPRGNVRHVSPAVPRGNDRLVSPAVPRGDNRQPPPADPSVTHTYANTHQAEPPREGTRPNPALPSERQLSDSQGQGTRSTSVAPQGRKLPESPGEGTSLTAIRPIEEGLPESPPSYEEAIDMPIPIPAAVVMDDPSPLYQNLNTTES
ncbi:uncharacterized protein LOC117331384 [Pecten maximus]|uniref:uncharacterized protein LOC117331384 n=1 Tax=Pecten maximus TaxID=6579 RepID=UPI001457E683|nr:uncharacterized protein LOC117331384 [Pecten maximus]